MVKIFYFLEYIITEFNFFHSEWNVYILYEYKMKSWNKKKGHYFISDNANDFSVAIDYVKKEILIDMRTILIRKLNLTQPISHEILRKFSMTKFLSDVN